DQASEIFLFEQCRQDLRRTPAHDFHGKTPVVFTSYFGQVSSPSFANFHCFHIYREKSRRTHHAYIYREYIGSLLKQTGSKKCEDLGFCVETAKHEDEGFLGHGCLSSIS